MTALPNSGGASKRLFKKFYSESFKQLIIGYTLETSLQRRCASGGLVSTLLAERISSGVSSGAILARVAIDDGEPKPHTFLALTPEEVHESSGSIYSDFHHIEGVKDILSTIDGVFDIVALPCQIRALRKAFELNEQMQKKVGLMIGLWCGHATDRALIIDFLRKWKVDPNRIETIKYRSGHWRGNTEITLKNGSKIVKSFKKNYGLFQNLYVDCKQRCFSCTDHFASYADISFGDCWIASEKASDRKKSMALSMNDKGNSAIQLLVNSATTAVERADPILAVQAQKRAVIWHTYSCKARSGMAKAFGLGINCNIDVKPRINDYLSAFMVLFSYWLFNTRARVILFKLPWWVLFPFMAIQKLMLNK